MSEAAQAFSSRRGFVNRNQLSVDSVGFFASAAVASAAYFARSDSRLPIPEQKQQFGCIFGSIWSAKLRGMEPD
jgi:hypothetical protein